MLKKGDILTNKKVFCSVAAGSDWAVAMSDNGTISLKTVVRHAHNGGDAYFGYFEDFDTQREVEKSILKDFEVSDVLSDKEVLALRIAQMERVLTNLKGQLDDNS